MGISVYSCSFHSLNFGLESKLGNDMGLSLYPVESIAVSGRWILMVNCRTPRQCLLENGIELLWGANLTYLVAETSEIFSENVERRGCIMSEVPRAP